MCPDFRGQNMALLCPGLKITKQDYHRADL